MKVNEMDIPVFQPLLSSKFLGFAAFAYLIRCDQTKFDGVRFVWPSLRAGVICSGTTDKYGNDSSGPRLD